MTQRGYATALVTGGAGFIGTRLVRLITDICNEIIVFDNLHPQVHGHSAAAPKLGSECKFVHGDVRDAAALLAVVQASQPDLVIHLAAETGTGQSYDAPAHYCDVNVTGTAHLVEALRRLPAARRRVVLASSRAVYGEGLYRSQQGDLVVPPPRSTAAMQKARFAPVDANGATLEPLATPETTPPAPASIYASTKLMQEFILQQGFDGTPIEVAVLRLQNVYGAGQSIRNPYTGVLSIFSQKLQEGHDIEIFEDGLITRDFVHVSDVVRALKSAAAVETVPTKPVNIGSGTPATIEAVARLLLKLHGRSPQDLTVTGNFRSGDVRHCLADISLARRTLAWSPRVELEEGLSDLVEWVVRGAPTNSLPTVLG
jgi:dTDP-L-rhamnose 4-epimerase